MANSMAGKYTQAVGIQTNNCKKGWNVFGVLSSEFKVWSSGFGVQSSEFRVLDLEGLAGKIVYNFTQNRLFLMEKPSRSSAFGV